jgi:hypothetical protein
MPYLNAAGDRAHGVGGVGAFVNNVQFSPGGAASWYDQDTVVFHRNAGGNWYVALYNVGGGTTQAAPRGANVLYGSGGGHWAGWLSGFGLFTSTGVNLPDAGLLGMGADGTLAYKASYQGQGLVLRAPGGGDTSLSSGPALEVHVVGPNQAVWQEGNVLKTAGLPNCMVLSGGIFQPHALQVGGEWWICYWSDAHGTVLHPFNSTEGYQPVGGDAFGIAAVVLSGTTVRFAWASTQAESNSAYVDIDVATAPRTQLGAGATVPGTGDGGSDGGSGTTGMGGRTLTSSASFPVAAAAEEEVDLEIEVLPAFPDESGYGRIIHPTLGPFDYEVKPDEWVNIDADAIIAPVWSSSRTLTSAANVLWAGNLRDVVVEERWKALGGLAMPITQFRMLLAIWTTPVDPDVGYVQWFPNYISGLGFNVLPVGLSMGGSQIVFDDVVNYKDEDGEPIGWVTNPVTFVLKLVERL